VPAKREVGSLLEAGAAELIPPNIDPTITNTSPIPKILPTKFLFMIT